MKDHMRQHKKLDLKLIKYHNQNRILNTRIINKIFRNMKMLFKMMYHLKNITLMSNLLNSTKSKDKSNILIITLVI